MANTVHEELVDAIKRHLPMQYEELNDIHEDEVYLKKLMESVDDLPLTFNLSEDAESWFNWNRENYLAGTEITAPEGFTSIVPELESELEPELEPEVEAAPESEPEPVAPPSTNGEDHSGHKWSEEARAKKKEQMRNYRANKAKKLGKPAKAAKAPEEPVA